MPTRLWVCFLAAVTISTGRRCPPTKEKLCTIIQPENNQNLLCTNYCTRAEGIYHKVPMRMCINVPHPTCNYCHCSDERYKDIETGACRTRVECLQRPVYEPQVDVRVYPRPPEPTRADRRFQL